MASTSATSSTRKIACSSSGTEVSSDRTRSTTWKRADDPDRGDERPRRQARDQADDRDHGQERGGGPQRTRLGRGRPAGDDEGQQRGGGPRVLERAEPRHQAVVQRRPATRVAAACGETRGRARGRAPNSTIIDVACSRMNSRVIGTSAPIEWPASSRARSPGRRLDEEAPDGSPSRTNSCPSSERRVACTWSSISSARASTWATRSWSTSTSARRCVHRAAHRVDERERVLDASDRRLGSARSPHACVTVQRARISSSRLSRPSRSSARRVTIASQVLACSRAFVPRVQQLVERGQRPGSP